MPSAMILCAGTRGDVEPFCALARALAESPGWNVLFCVQSDYGELVPSHKNIETFSFPFGQANMVAMFSNPEATAAATAAAKESSQSSLYIWSMLGSLSSSLIVPSTQDLLAAATAAQVDVVVYTLLQRPLALTVADKLQAKSCYVHLQPQVPTALFPHHRNQQQAAEGIVAAAQPGALDSLTSEVQEANLESYWAVERTLFAAYSSRMNAERETAGLSALSYEAMCDTAVGTREGMVIANAFPSSIVPHLADLGTKVHAVGPLADSYMPAAWEPPAELDEYLASGTPPVCVGFGSMRVNNKRRVAQLVYSALRAAGVERAVVVGGTAGISSSCIDVDKEGGQELLGWVDMHVFYARTEVPYAWLLPRCCVMMCQGGAGVVAAALRGGAALVVSPVLADQFMWGRVVDAMELGAFAGPSLEEVSLGTLKMAVETAIGEKVQKKVAEVRKAVQAEESGVGKLVGLLKSLLSDTAGEAVGI